MASSPIQPLLKALTRFTLGSAGIIGLTSFGHLVRCDMHEREENERTNHHTINVIGDRLMNYKLEHFEGKVNYQPPSPSTQSQQSQQSQQQQLQGKYLVVYINELGNARPVIPMPFQLSSFSKWLKQQQQQQEEDASTHVFNSTINNKHEMNDPLIHIMEYDRLGAGFSNETDTPRHALNSAYELYSLLQNLDRNNINNRSINNNNNNTNNNHNNNNNNTNNSNSSNSSSNEKIILVTEGYGSLIGRLFTAQFPNDIAGIVCIDPLVEKSLEDDQFRKQISKQVQQAQMMKMMSTYGLIEWLNLLQSSHLSHRFNDWNTFIEERKHLIRSCRQVHEAREASASSTNNNNSIPIIFLNQKEESRALENNKSAQVATMDESAQKASRYMQFLVDRNGHPLSQYKEIDLDDPLQRQKEVCNAVNQFILNDLKGMVKEQ